MDILISEGEMTMKATLDKVMYHNGYVVIVMTDGDINIYKQGNFVLHANCEIMDSAEEIQEIVDELLAFKESLEQKPKEVSA